MPRIKHFIFITLMVPSAPRYIKHFAVLIPASVTKFGNTLRVYLPCIWQNYEHTLAIVAIGQMLNLIALVSTRSESF